MLEQTTIQQGLTLAQEWGATGTMIVGFIIYQIVYAKNVKKHAVDPSVENRKIIDQIVKDNKEQYKYVLDKIHSLDLDLKDRVPFAWAEDKLVPKIDKMSEDINKLSLVTEKYSTIVNSQVKVGEHLYKSIDALTQRLSKIESSK